MEDRAADDPVAMLGKLRSEFDEFRTTVMARVNRLPIGTVLGCLLPSPMEGTLFLQGQIILRAEFPALWDWANNNQLVGAGVGKWFGVGDNSTTFVLPDWRNQVLVGASATWPLASKVGAVTDSVALLPANMPLHGHSISGSVSSVGDHDHDVTGSGGYHDNHFPDWGYDVMTNGAAGGAISGRLARQLNDGGRRPYEAHGHPMTWDGGHSHGHTLAAANAGSANPTPVAVDVVQPSTALNYMIWT